MSFLYSCSCSPSLGPRNLVSAGHYYPYSEIYEFFQKDQAKAEAFCRMRRDQPKGLLVCIKNRFGEEPQHLNSLKTLNGPKP